MQKNFCFWVAFSPWLPFYYSVSLFHAPGLKGIIKRGRLKPFLTMTSTKAKIFLLFCNCLSFTYPELCSDFHAPNSKAKGKSLNSFLAKLTGVFSGYTPKIMSLVKIIQRNEEMRNIKKKKKSIKRIKKIINNQLYVSQNYLPRKKCKACDA